MVFEWDADKNRTNKRKHGVSFELAILIFEDPHIISVPTENESEERWLSVDFAKNMIALSVAHTWREQENEEIIRIISARKATIREIREYQNQFQNR